MRAAVFLDRDGVINENRPDHVRAWDQVHFLPGVFNALRLLASREFAVIVVTNQSAVGRGLMTSELLHAINVGIVERIYAEGGRIDAVYTCPHSPEAGCDCRKPKPGMLLAAAHELQLDLASSFFVGDAVTDVEAAIRAGCQPIMVCTGRGQAHLAKLKRESHGDVAVVADLSEAIESILGGEK
jgi:D-glycero-D-manno-heptose 1,7-bisphosphate phosphatase